MASKQISNRLTVSKDLLSTGATVLNETKDLVNTRKSKITGLKIKTTMVIVDSCVEVYKGVGSTALGSTDYTDSCV